MSEKTKSLLLSAARAGVGDTNWNAGGVDRLYFEDPKDLNSAGSVDVLRSADGSEPDYVRVELWVAPARAAEILALVTGERESLEAHIRAEMMARVQQEHAEMLAQKEAAEKAEETASEPAAPDRVKLPATRQDLEDAARADELKGLIASQGEDDES